jgi:hypothetical protein
MRRLGDGVVSGYIGIRRVMLKTEAFNMIFEVLKPQFIALCDGYIPESVCLFVLVDTASRSEKIKHNCC